MFTNNWWLIKIPALLIFPFIFYDIEVIIFMSSFLVIHLTLGLKTILNDYLHSKVSKVLLIILIRLSSIEFLRYVIELLI